MEGAISQPPVMQSSLDHLCDPDPMGSSAPSDPIPIFKGSNSSLQNSISPRRRKNSYTGTSVVINGVPKIMVVDSHGHVWSSGELPQLHESSPSPPSTSSSYLNLPHHLNSTQSLVVDSGRRSEEEHFYSQEDIRPMRRRRRSLNIFRSAVSDPRLTNTRFCESEDENEEMASSLQNKKKKKKKFLAVDDAPLKRRNRSASTDASIFLQDTSPSSSNKMKKFFKRLRSRSQGEISLPPNFSPSSNATSQEDVNNEFESSYMRSPDGEYGELPATAINISLLTKFKNYLGFQPRKLSSHDIYNQMKQQRRHSDFMNNNERDEAFIEHPYEATESLNSSQEFTGSHETMDRNYLSPYAEEHSLSNSESELTIEMKPKKKTFVSRFRYLRKQQKKRDRSGSLPNVLDDDEIHQRFKARALSGYNDDSSSIGRRGSDDKIVCMGDFAIDDYFGEHGESLSLENLVEGENYIQRKVRKDKQTNYSMDNIFDRYGGKSRSMEYTFHGTFDLENLKRRLGDRTSSEPSRDPLDPSEVGGRGDLSSSDKRGPPITLLSGPVISYTVQANDTLMSIAARFDTTPSELTKMNRLSTRFLFPGQILTVPDKGGAKENFMDVSKDDSEAFKDPHTSPLLTDLAPEKYTDNGNFPKTPANSIETERSLDKDCLEKFLKISVRHITDGQGVVAGVLLVTPNAVMFDPNVSDPLVIERGSESYGVIAPMDFVVNAALYYDIAHMKVKDTGLPRPEIPKPEIYFGPTSQSAEPLPEEDESMATERSDRLLGAEIGVLGGSEESPSKDGTFPELASNDNDNDSTCSCGGETRETSAFPKAFEHELLTPISSDASPTAGEGLQPPSFVQGDLAPIEEGNKLEDGGSPSEPSPSPSPIDFEGMMTPSPTPAQNQCDTKPHSEPLAQKVPLAGCSSLPPPASQPHLTNDKKRTTSVTFSSSSESEMPPLLEDDNIEMASQESRKQKVLKRISYPLSWMESLSGDPTKDLQSGGQGQQGVPSSAPPIGNWMGMSGGSHPMAGDLNDSNRPGMFSNVFTTGISNVSNMLTRRTSSDFTKRAPNQGGESPQPSSSPVPEHPSNNPQAQKRIQFKEGPKFGLKSMVSMDEMPDLFASFDKRWRNVADGDRKSKLIPKPASTCDESPLYLCLRMGTPIGKVIPRSTPIMTYGKKTMRPEYWFSIPRDRTDELYHFFQIWASDLYGELDEGVIRDRGFNLLEEEVEIWPQLLGEGGFDGGFDATGELKEITKESWEVVSMSEELRKALYSSSSLTSLDIEAFLPDLQDTSEVIDDSIRKNIYRKLPARVQGYNWKLVFSSSQHGFSLKSLYRKMSDVDSAILLYIQDTNQNIFGSFLACPIRVSDLFYGTGEAFLFKCQPEFEVFSWTGENTFFAKGNNDSLVIGGGDGKFGIFLDGDLYQGRSESCSTFGNPVLSDTEDFIIKTIECWCFV